MYRKPYRHIGLGGTFDHFHAGHEHFLSFASKLADKLTIGITQRELTLGKEYSATIEPLKKRIAHVVRFCKKQSVAADIFELTDVYGPTLTDKSIQALAVTEMTTQGAKLINETRAHMKLKDLPVHVCTMLRDGQGDIHSSTLIRSGISLKDATRLDVLLTQKSLQFSEDQKRDMRSIPTTPITSFEALHHPQKHPRIVVGDVSVSLFLQQEWPFSIGVIDGHSQRTPIAENLLSQCDLQVKNPAGTIQSELAQALIDGSRHTADTPLLIGVDGEEDLAALAALFIAPLGSTIYFGDPHKNIVSVDATLMTKQKILTILAQN